VVFERILQPFVSSSVVHLLPMIGRRGSLVIVPHRLVLMLGRPQQRYCPIQTTGLVAVDCLMSTFPNHTSPAIVRSSPLQRGHRTLVVDAACRCDGLDLAVLVLHPGYIDDLVVAENGDSPFVGIETDVPVVDVNVALSVAIFVVLAFVVAMLVVASEFQLSIGQRSIAAGFE
jgi:hypothetical protein